MKNPNRFRAVMGALAGNHAGFHHASGAGYALLADNLIALDKLNPQTPPACAPPSRAGSATAPAARR